nr:hypothetical protein [Peribacillus deserti]
MTQLQFSPDMELLKHSMINSNFDTVVQSAIVLVLNEFMFKRTYALMVEVYAELNGLMPQEICANGV